MACPIDSLLNPATDAPLDDRRRERTPESPPYSPITVTSEDGRHRECHQQILTVTPQGSQESGAAGRAVLVPFAPHQPKRPCIGKGVLGTPPYGGTSRLEDGGHGAPFNIFAAILNRNDVLLEFFRRLDVETIIDLYAISRDFHIIVDAHMTSFVRANARNMAFESASTFHFMMYKRLCIPDPIGRPHPYDPKKTRKIPSLRWLSMVHYREKVVAEIIAALAAEGHRMPQRASLTIKRIWLTMEVRSNVRRIGLVHYDGFWSDEDLGLATLFFIKLDMRFLDPVDGIGNTRLRDLFIGQKSMTPLWQALTGRAYTTFVELWQMYIRYAYVPDPDCRGMSILGVPPDEIGMNSRDLSVEEPADPYEKPFLFRPDEVVMREAIRRELDLEDEYIDMTLWGYIDLETGRDIEPGETMNWEPDEVLDLNADPMDDQAQPADGDDDGVDPGQGVAKASAAYAFAHDAFYPQHPAEEEQEQLSNDVQSVADDELIVDEAHSDDDEEGDDDEVGDVEMAEEHDNLAQGQEAEVEDDIL